MLETAMHEIRVGDCLDVLSDLNAKRTRFDVVITDPPYSAKVHNCGRRGISPDYTEPTRPNATRAQFNRNRELGFEYLSPDLRKEAARLFAAMADRWVLIFADVEGVTGWRRDCEAAGLEYVRTCFWRKRGATPQFTGDRPASHVEAVIAFHQTHASGKPKKKRWNGGGRGNVFEHPIVLNRGVGTVPCRVHSAQKPLSLMVELVELFSDPGEVICDPFCGSGTTLVAAKKTGRRSFGIEADEQSAAVAVTRVQRTRPARKAKTA